MQNYRTKNYRTKLAYCLGSLLYVVCSSAVATTPSTSGGLAPKPLFLGGNAEPNIMFDIDDSGSMDWEMLVSDVPSGLPRWSSSSQSFFDSDGDFFTSGSVYAYNFPNGRSYTYNGKKMVGDADQYYSVPPVDAYAFSRSPDYNPAYYDPSATYIPWPSYGGYTFPNSSPTAAKFEPISAFSSAGTIDLTATRSSGSSEETFRIQTGMVCDNFGTTSCASNANIPYYPATYYTKDVSPASSYIYTTDPGFDSSNSVLLELEDGVITSPMYWANHGPASGGSYIGTNNGETDYMTTPTSPATVKVAFTMTGTVNIWIRRYFWSSNNDSFWINLKDHDETDITEYLSNRFVTQSGQSWLEWNGHDNIQSSWQWEKYATVNLNGSSHELTLMLRESASYGDVVLVTQNLTSTPEGVVTLSAPGPAVPPETRSCDSVSPSHYRDFVADPLAFTGVDAIGPDGSCLKKVEIKSSTPTYSIGESYSRTYADEIQNFANWFTYYRRRHQSMRGGVAAALEGVSGIRTGMFWFNKRQNVTMGSFDSAEVPTGSGHVEKFLKAHYERVQWAGTPTRQSLDYAGYQYSRTGSGAPITASCQRNFTLVFTDGFANDIPGNSVGNTDNDTGSYSGVAPYTDSYSNTLADIAMKYYKNNLRPDLNSGLSPVSTGCAVATPDPSLDCNSDLHMNTYAIGLNATGDIIGKTHFTVADAYATPPTWIDPTDSSGPVQADDFYHAAVNGRGEIFNASTPDGLKTALQDAVIDILEAASEGGASSVAFNTSTLKSSSIVMAASFNAAQWSGELEGLNLDATTGAITTTAWKASEELDAMDPDDRFIFTYNGSSGTLFNWASLSPTQKNDLNMGPSGADANGSARLDYIRGDRSLEGTSFRTRDSVLGDIVHSSPVFVGKPELGYPDTSPFGAAGDRYSSYKVAQADRDQVVYVGANDGMLHGFLTEDVGLKSAGSEIMAYIPNSIYSDQAQTGLHYYTDTNYSHRNYVDGTPIAADVYINGAWKTLLIGTLRGGGKGLYALDVTDPTTFTDANVSQKVVWEFTDSDHSDLGYITDKPVVAMMNNNKWAVIFGNGYGSSATKLFILYIEAGADGSWSSSDYEVLETGTASGGLSAPALADMDANGTVDRIYAGDLAGNMWVFDVTASNDNSWGSAYKQGSTEKPLFTTASNQPITASPVLALNPNVGDTLTNAPNVLVLFGTGQYLVGGDVANNDIQSFYAVWDSGTDELVQSDLEPRTITNASGYRTTTGDAVDWEGTTSQQYGWYMNFNVSGDDKERVVLAPNVRAYTVFFNTLIPSADSCSSGGRGYLMSVDLRDGFTPSKPIFDSNGDNLVDDSDTAYSGEMLDNIPMDSGFLGDTQYTPTNIGTIEQRKIDLQESNTRVGRLSWLELFTD
jgi:type IV pilus assembly protein PilY1